MSQQLSSLAHRLGRHRPSLTTTRSIMLPSALQTGSIHPFKDPHGESLAACAAVGSKTPPLRQACNLACLKPVQGMPGEGILCQFKTGTSAIAETRFSSLLLKPKNRDFEELRELLEPYRLPWGTAGQRTLRSVDGFQLQQTSDIQPLRQPSNSLSDHL